MRWIFPLSKMPSQLRTDPLKTFKPNNQIFIGNWRGSYYSRDRVLQISIRYTGDEMQRFGKIYWCQATLKLKLKSNSVSNNSYYIKRLIYIKWNIFSSTSSHALIPLYISARYSVLTTAIVRSEVEQIHFCSSITFI